MTRNKRKIFIINQQGKREPFSFYKILKSAKRAGASPKTARIIAEKIKSQTLDGAKTIEIFQQVRALLNQAEPVAFLRFNLKEAMRKLGPTGFPFEKFIARVLEKDGFEVKLNQLILGRCIDYEIDCLAIKQNQKYLVECKYRQLANDVVDVNDVLTFKAKVDDIKEGNQEFKVAKMILATNAKFTTKAIKYANCEGIGLLGWQYPKDNGLEKIIDQNKLYPITILPSLSKDLLFNLNKQNIILVGDLLKAHQENRLNFIQQNQLARITQEVNLLQ